MKWQFTLFLWTLTILALAGCSTRANAVTSISLDFPNGGLRLLVQRDGDPHLFYGELPTFWSIRKGIFNIDELFSQLQSRLHENAPAEGRLAGQPFGMVAIQLRDGSSREYLIYDEEFTGQLLKKVCLNRLPNQEENGSSEALFERECANIR
jgi:hypothetical protein